MKILTVKRGIDAGPTIKPLAIYCSTPSGEEEIEGIFCKKVCSLRPGEERTFDVNDSEAELFAVFDADGNKIVGRYSVGNNLNFTKLILKRAPQNEDYEFVFSEQKVRAPRLSRKLVGAICAGALILVILLGLIAYYWGGNIYWFFKGRSKTPMQFETSEISITLTRAFVQDFANKDCHATYYSPDPCWVFIDSDEFEDVPELEDITLSEYCILLMEANGDEHLEPVYLDGMMYYVDEVIADEEEFIIYTYVYRSDDSFWFVQFGSTVERSEYWEKCYQEWAKSVEFK